MGEIKNEIWSLFNKRVSIRSFSDKDIDDEMIDFLIKCATTAPSNGNMQPWEFIVINSDEVKAKIVECTYTGYFSKGSNHQIWIQEAPVVIVACANKKRTRARYGEMGTLGSIIDTAAAIQNTLVAAAGVGLGSCWVGGFNEERLKEILQIPEHVKPIGILPIGYPKGGEMRKNRLPTNIVKHKNIYNQ